MLSEEYIAGFFDGEGCVMISPEGRCRVTITQKNPEVLKMIQDKFGGVVYSKHSKVSVCHHWVALKKDTIITFLKNIQPFSVVKKSEIELGIQCTHLVRTDNIGCHPLTAEEMKQRMDLRQKMQEIRPSSKFKNLTSQNFRYRDFIKERSLYRCNVCETDLKEIPIRDQVISQDKLWCRSCAASRTNKRPLKPISKERIEEVLKTCNNLDEACLILNIGRSALFKKRKQYGLPNRIMLRGKKRGTYIETTNET